MLLMNYLKKIKLPNIVIKPYGEVSKSFLKENVSTFWDAIEYVHNLPYGRTTNRENYLQVLNEKKGACSAKHALITTLAEELSIPLKLTIGIFLLTTKNMPKIDTILKRYHLQAIPESHCYLKYNNHTLDIKFPDSTEFSFNAHLEEEINITPQQIGLFKIEKHQTFIKAWIKNNAALSFDLVWDAREQWIAELSQQDQ